MTMLALGVTTFATAASVLAGPRVDVRVQWLPDPAQASDWDHATAEATKAAGLTAADAQTLPPEVSAFNKLLDRAGRDAVTVSLEDAAPDMAPVELARLIADEVPFAIDSICADGAAEYIRPCEEIERWGVTSIGVRVPSQDERHLEGYHVQFGFRPGLLTCLIELGCGDD